ncbi:2Fe-2S iron-sulfur cluster-binding protein [Hahella ganghwensis]|uniref:2Fe-2S iron-sulfur cluster-binding protein n=1 Tax=Hahella ganghwensis TaxID=286420 RepID=UPI00037D76DD|nr:2Fe-2S iron-sulfur cluster binding domain-containing protein [Hahella ganghwensis]
MAQVRFAEVDIVVPDGQSLLDALEKAGQSIPSSCRSGLCHACLLRADEGEIPAQAQSPLSSRQKAQKLLLACQCYPTSSLRLSVPKEASRVKATLVDKVPLGRDILRVRFTSDVAWFPGQYTTLWRNDTEGRSFSIASHPERDGFLELHVRKRAGGVISDWLDNRLMPGQECLISQPRGQCFYTPECRFHPLLLVATGTGLSPIYGVLKEALDIGHTFPIYLYAAAGDPEGLYLVRELKELAHAFPQLHFRPVVRRQPEIGMLEGDVVDVVSSQHEDLKDWRVFLCGTPETVRKLQKKCFLQGASMSAIVADAFESPLNV